MFRPFPPVLNFDIFLRSSQRKASPVVLSIDDKRVGFEPFALAIQFPVSACSAYSAVKECLSRSASQCIATGCIADDSPDHHSLDDSGFFRPQDSRQKMGAKIPGFSPHIPAHQ
jgi:hypothetical protein